MRILIVDDRKDVIDDVAQAVRLGGHEVWVAYGDAVALNLIEGHRRFDGYAFDYTLGPVSLSGAALLESLRRNGDMTPCVLITGHVEMVEVLRERCDGLGKVAVLLKPFLPTDLVRELEAMR